MKENFLIAKDALNKIGIVRVCSDFYIAPKPKGHRYFVKSPASVDKHWSMCLYPNTWRNRPFKAVGDYLQYSLRKEPLCAI